LPERHRTYRRSIAAVATPVAVALACTLVWPPGPVLIWNVTASSRVGLYAIAPADDLHVGDTVIAWAPDAPRRLAAARHYLPADVPLVKRVSAVAGDRVCATGAAISVNGRVAALRRSRDPSGRPMPWWAGCLLLGPGELLLLSPARPLAFDGRYFGVSRPAQIIGRAMLLWPR
jgi:conjugative transfer signal peptidase TraF